MKPHYACIIWLKLALKPSVVLRGVGYAIIVGSLLIFINHSDKLMSGEITYPLLGRMGLTVMVPYLVSTLSSVGAMRAQQQGCDKNESDHEPN